LEFGVRGRTTMTDEKQVTETAADVTPLVPEVVLDE
jgi:hypothetical protein